MRNAHVAIAGCRRSDDAAPTDLYPDPDAGPLGEALRGRGGRARFVGWDDPSVEWGSFSHVVLSSTWDSVDRPGEYLTWARQVAEVTRLVNPAPVLEWNIDKVYLRELEAAGVPVIATTWVGPGDLWEPPSAPEIVVKPSVSAGGRSTARYANGDPAAADHVRMLQRGGQTVMVQEYHSAVDEDGEVDVVFIDGRFSHAVLKKAALRTGDGVLPRPWERMAQPSLTSPTAEQLGVATETMRFVSDRFARPPTYGRVDLIPGPHRRPVVLELELIDPYLSLDMSPSAARELAWALIAG